MIKTVNGTMKTSGEMPTILFDFMATCDGFIQYIMDEFKVDESKAIHGYAALAEIVRECFKKPDRRTTIYNRVVDVLDFLAADNMNQLPNVTAKTIVIEADSPEDAMRQVKEVLNGIMEMEGDE